MSFLTQRLQNSFPVWTKIRNTASSTGAIVLDSTIAPVDAMRQNGHSNLRDLSLHKEWLGIGELYKVVLSEDDYFGKETNTNTGAYIYEYPTVTGDGNTLTRVSTSAELYYGSPTRFGLAGGGDYEEAIVWESTDRDEYGTYTRPNFLSIEILNSTVWYKREDRRDTLFNNDWFIRIEGEDQNYLKIEETIYVKDDGTYKTKNVFSSVSLVEWAGFDGSVTIRNREVSTKYVDQLYFGAQVDYESPLLIESSKEVIDSTMHSFFNLYTYKNLYGPDYRRPNVEDMEQTEEMLSTVLLDESGNPYEIAGYTYSPEDNRYYVVDVNGKIYVYDLSLPSFTKATGELGTATEDVNMILTFLSQYPKYGQTERCATYLVRPRTRVLEVTIKRRDPNGNIRYLQSDKTWGASSYTFRPNYSSEGLNWQELSFETTYDLIGEWEYMVSYKDSKESTVSIQKVCVACLLPIYFSVTDMSDVSEVYFNWENRLCITDGSQLLELSIHRDYWMADTQNNLVILREAYSEVGVNY